MEARKPCSGCARSRRMISTSADGAVADLAGLPPQALRRPVGVTPVARRHVLAHGRVLAVGRRAHMRRNPLAAVEQFDRARGDARPDLLAQQAMGRRVVVLVDLDVVVEPDPAFLPRGEDVGLGRQRLERRAVQLLEERTAARPEMPRHAVIELRDQLGDGGVQRRQREEAPIAQLGDDEARRHLDGGFDLRLGECRRLQVV